MAELLMRLKQYDKSEKCIAQALEVESTSSTSIDALQSLMSQAKFYELLAQVHERSGKLGRFLLCSSTDGSAKISGKLGRFLLCSTTDVSA